MYHRLREDMVRLMLGLGYTTMIQWFRKRKLEIFWQSELCFHFPTVQWIGCGGGGGVALGKKDYRDGILLSSENEAIFKSVNQIRFLTLWNLPWLDSWMQQIRKLMIKAHETSMSQLDWTKFSKSVDNLHCTLAYICIYYFIFLTREVNSRLLYIFMCRW